LAEQLQRFCHDTLPWLISFSLDLMRANTKVTILVSLFTICGAAAFQLHSQTQDKNSVPAASASPISSPAETPTSDSDDELDHPSPRKPTGEDCGLWKELAPNTDLQVVTWLIPDAKHVSRFERSGFSVTILHLPFDPEQHVIARHDFLGLRISHMRWSPDSKFLLFTTASSGGHSPWHSRTFVFCMADKSFRDVEAAVGSVLSPKFHFEPPDVAVLIVQKGDSPESETKISLGRTVRDMPHVH
jgi:hypothetical protein